MNTEKSARRGWDLERLCAGRVPNVLTSLRSLPSDAWDVAILLHKGPEVS